MVGIGRRGPALRRSRVPENRRQTVRTGHGPGLARREQEMLRVATETGGLQ